MELTGNPNETDRRPVRNDVRDVHVKQYDMCMWNSTTCACGAVQHVHVKQRCIPEVHTLLYEIRFYPYISLYETFFLRFSIDSALFWNLFSIFATCLMCCYEKPYLYHIYFRITSYDTWSKLCSGHSSYCKEGYGKK